MKDLLPMFAGGSSALSVRHWASILSRVTQWMWSLSLDSTSTQCVKQILLLSRFYRWTSFGVFYCFKTNQPTSKRIPLFPVVISLKLEWSWEKGGDPCWEKGGDPCWLLRRLEASDMEEMSCCCFSGSFVISAKQNCAFLRVPCY